MHSGSPPASASQSLTLPAQLPDARRRPSRLNATLIGRFSCPGKVCRGRSFLQSQTVTTPSLPAASRRPSGLNATAYAVPNTWTASARAVEHREAGRQVPDLHPPVRADGGQVPAVGVERDAGHVAAVRVLEGPDHLTRPAVPDLDGPVPARGGEELAVGAERQAVDFGLVPEDDRLDPAEPHEVVPLPLAQVFRALVEEFEGTAQVVRGQFAVGQCDPVEVRIPPQVVLGPGLGSQRLRRRPLLARDQERARRQSRHRQHHHQGHGRRRRPPPSGSAGRTCGSGTSADGGHACTGSSSR